MPRAIAKKTKPIPGKKPIFDLQVFLDTSGAARRIEKFRRSERIYSQGDPARGVKYIQTGGVKLSVINEDGRSGGGHSGTGRVFWRRMPSRPAGLHGYGYRDGTHLHIVHRKKEMMRALRTEHAFSDLFISHMLTRNIRIEEDLVDQLFNSSEKRLARSLLLLARYGQEDQPQGVIPKVSQEMLAEMIGTTRSRVNFFMNKFRKMGFIKYNGGLQVNASLLSVVLHD